MCTMSSFSGIWYLNCSAIVVLRRLKIYNIQLGHVAGRLLVKSRGAASQVKFIAAGWMHKCCSLRKCASMAKRKLTILGLGQSCRISYNRNIQIPSWMYSSTEFQHNNEVQNYFSTSSTCQLDLVILWVRANWTQWSSSLWECERP